MRALLWFLIGLYLCLAALASSTVGQWHWFILDLLGALACRHNIGASHG
jgi:hypothetical protein